MKTFVTLHDLYVNGLDMKVWNKIHKDLDNVYTGTRAERWDRIDHVPIRELAEAYEYRHQNTGHKMCKSVREVIEYNRNRLIEC